MLQDSGREEPPVASKVGKETTGRTHRPDPGRGQAAGGPGDAEKEQPRRGRGRRRPRPSPVDDRYRPVSLPEADGNPPAGRPRAELPRVHRVHHESPAGGPGRDRRVQPPVGDLPVPREHVAGDLPQNEDPSPPRWRYQGGTAGHAVAPPAESARFVAGDHRSVGAVIAEAVHQGPGPGGRDPRYVGRYPIAEL